MQPGKESSMLWSIVVSFALMIPDLIAAVMADSVTLYADVLKCSGEVLAMVFSWLTLRRLARGGEQLYDYGLGKLENLTSLAVAGIMFLCLAVVLFAAWERFEEPAGLHASGAGLGIVLMLVGVGTNGWYWLKNIRLARREHSPVLEAQWRLFRVRTAADATVLLALVLSLALHRYQWSHYIDPVASLVVALFIIHSIHGVFSHSVGDLLDKTLDESLQLVIIRHLAEFFNEYRTLHGVRSRRAGSATYIEIFLEFEGERSMAEVQRVIDAMRTSIEARIKGSSVIVAPVTAPPRQTRAAAA